MGRPGGRRRAPGAFWLERAPGGPHVGHHLDEASAHGTCAGARTRAPPGPWSWPATMDEDPAGRLEPPQAGVAAPACRASRRRSSASLLSEGVQDGSAEVVDRRQDLVRRYAGDEHEHRRGPGPELLAELLHELVAHAEARDRPHPGAGGRAGGPADGHAQQRPQEEQADQPTPQRPAPRRRPRRPRRSTDWCSCTAPSSRRSTITASASSMECSVRRRPSVCITCLAVFTLG